MSQWQLRVTIVIGSTYRTPSVAHDEPAQGAPLVTSPASITVVARTCEEANAWATTLMVLGEDSVARLARQLGLDALFLVNDDDGCIWDIAVGPLFSNEAEAVASTWQ